MSHPGILSKSPSTHPRNSPTPHEHNLPPLPRHPALNLHPAWHHSPSCFTNGVSRRWVSLPASLPLRDRNATSKMGNHIPVGQSDIRASRPTQYDQAGQCDTREPANLLDTDFLENITELPLSRPETDHTPMQFLVVKNRILDVFSSICELTTRIQPSTYAEILNMDTLLSKAYSSIPNILKIKPLGESLSDPSHLIICRIFLLLVFHKAQITLHRKYLVPARKDQRYTYSRLLCVKAAIVMLGWQEEVERECGVGGRFEVEKWKISSLVRMEFLVATTVLCLDLDWEIKNLKPSLDADSNFETVERDCEGRSTRHSNGDGGRTYPGRADIVKALTTSYHIWQRFAETSKEAKKAATVLRILLSKAHSHASMTSSTAPLPVPTIAASSSVEMRTYANSAHQSLNSNHIDQFQPQYSNFSATNPIPQELNQPLFMDTWLLPDVEGGNGLGFYPDTNSDPYDMANWGLDEYAGGAGAIAWDSMEGFEGMGEFTS
ncbi:hypothetical protein ONS96_001399 [Cadophora gregata f. sp. sojae]|nr:hypothetical protein ONS96_001399 [Cadophora gregata f. sp. sojae]